MDFNLHQFAVTARAKNYISGVPAATLPESSNSIAERGMHELESNLKSEDIDRCKLDAQRPIDVVP